MPGSMRVTFLLSLAAMALLFVTLWKYELASKHASMRLRALKRALAGDEAAGPLARTAAPTQLGCPRSRSTRPGPTWPAPISSSSH